MNLAIWKFRVEALKCILFSLLVVLPFQKFISYITVFRVLSFEKINICAYYLSNDQLSVCICSFRSSSGNTLKDSSEEGQPPPPAKPKDKVVTLSILPSVRWNHLELTSQTAPQENTYCTVAFA